MTMLNSAGDRVARLFCIHCMLVHWKHDDAINRATLNNYGGGGYIESNQSHYRRMQLLVVP